jgi:hypothetical protein
MFIDYGICLNVVLIFYLTTQDKRYPVDSMERNQLQKCLDILQHSIKVTSLQGMVERLESVTRQLGYVTPHFI